MAIRVVGGSAPVSAADVKEVANRIKKRSTTMRGKNREKRGITFINQYVIILLFLPFENG
jgi:hypothetical protein